METDQPAIVGAPPPDVYEPANRFNDWVRALLTAYLVTLFFGYLGYASYHPPQLPGDLLGAVFGWIAGWISGAFSLYFGASIMQRMTKRDAIPSAPVSITPAPDSKTTVTTETPKQTTVIENK